MDMYKQLPQHFPQALGWVSGLTPTPVGTVGASQHHCCKLSLGSIEHNLSVIVNGLTICRFKGLPAAEELERLKKQPTCLLVVCKYMYQLRNTYTLSSLFYPPGDSILVIFISVIVNVACFISRVRIATYNKLQVLTSEAYTSNE